jgi:hypothetical protein
VRLDNAWLTATSQVLLGSLAMEQGRLEDAHALSWRSWRGTRSGRRCWRGRPRACADGSASGRGRRTARFDEAFAAGGRLSQREAVAAAQTRRSAGTRAS